MTEPNQVAETFDAMIVAERALKDSRAAFYAAAKTLADGSGPRKRLSRLPTRAGSVTEGVIRIIEALGPYRPITSSELSKIFKHNYNTLHVGVKRMVKMGILTLGENGCLALARKFEDFDGTNA
jgi:hypothetical protein